MAKIRLGNANRLPVSWDVRCWKLLVSFDILYDVLSWDSECSPPLVHSRPLDSTIINRAAADSFQFVKDPLTQVWLSPLKKEAPEPIAAFFKISSYGLAERRLALIFSGELPINRILSDPHLEEVSEITRKARFIQLNCNETSKI